MIIEAIDKRTKELVKIEEACSGQRVTCPHCCVDMHPVLGVPMPFFRCYEGGKHTNYICEQLDRTNRAYDPKLTDIKQLFINLFSPINEKERSPEEPEEDPDVLDPDDEMLDEDGSELDTDDGDEEEDGVSSKPVIVPCNTLRQLWKAGIDKFGSSERIGSSLRSDIFLWYRDFDPFFARKESLDERVIAVRPQWPINRVNAILFASFSGIYGTGKYKTKYFILEFQDRKEFNKACRKLFSRSTDSTGINRTKAKYDMVLVAGDWTELDESDYGVYGIKSGEHIYGAQISDFYSKNQIYPIPQQKRKEK